MRLGPFAFPIRPEDVRQFRKATGLVADGPVPLAFLARFFTEPEVLAALTSHYGAKVPIHVAQSFRLFSTPMPGALSGLVKIKADRVTARLCDSTGADVAELVGEFAFR